MVREFIVDEQVPFKDRLRNCILEAMNLAPAASALSDIEAPLNSTLYPELMYLLCQRCENYLRVYYNDDGGIKK